MDTTETTHLSLCSGYGGIDLGLRRVISNLRTVAYAEIEAFACENLLARMEGGQLDAAPIWSDLKSFPWEQFSGLVDILSGGYPCQPFSSAGKRTGADDPRHLWPFISAGIAAMRPGLCFFENVEGHISLGLREVIADLESLGYQTTWGIFSAAEVGAPHQRKRVFIMAISSGFRSAAGLSGPLTRHEGITGIADHCGAQDIWPSRPGEPQHAWEPPRVVGDAESSRRCGSGLSVRSGKSCEAPVDAAWAGESLGDSESGARLGRASGDEGHAAQPDESVGNASSERPCGGAPHGSGQQPEVSGARHEGSEFKRQTQPAMGLHIDESSSVLGETLTLNPYVANVDGYENLSQKTRARQILFEVWKQASSKTIQWETRRLQCFLAEKILLSGMQLDSFTQRICYFIWCVQTGYPAQGWGLHGMWVYESCGNSSQGHEPIEQFKRELGYALCQLSYEIALERGEEVVEAKGILQGVRESSERAWALSDALPEMEEVWRSTLDQKVWENGCFNEATSKGNRTDELRLLGNGVVPATAEKAFRTLWNQHPQPIHTHDP